ncbi:MAG: hypothetical protein ABH956_01280 [Candidatus Nealsonbacteria bacterium]
MIKKIISIATILTVATMIAGPGPAQGATMEELQAQIQSLQAQLTSALAQLTALGGSTGSVSVGGSVPAACAAVSAFTRSLSSGSTGADVQCLQAMLNTDPATQVAMSGVGSTGMETMYYGGLTAGGVSKFQVKHAATVLAPLGLVAGTGYFGPSTMAAMNSALNTLRAVIVDTDTDTDTDSGSESDPASSSCNGEEGSYTVTLSGTPAGGTVNAGLGLPAYGFDVTAVNSIVNIGRVDFQVAVVNATTAVAENPGNFITALYIYKGSVSDENLVKKFSNPVFTQDAAAVWYTQLVGLDFKVADGEKEKLIIVMDTTTTIDQNRTTTVRLYSAANGVRGTDCAGINSYTSIATTRVWTVQQPGVATLTISAATDNPNTRYIQADANNGVQTKETLLSLNAKATAGSTTLVRLEVTYASNTSAARTPSVLYLYDGDTDTMITSATPNATENGAATFENFIFPFNANQTRNLKIKADWAASDAVFAAGGAFTLTNPASTAANVAGGIHQRANGQQVGVVTSAAIASNMVFIAEEGLELTFVSGKASWSQSGQTSGVGTATGTITFTVKPFGGTLQEPAYASHGTSAAAGIVTSGMLVRIEGYWLGSGSDAIYASGTQLAVAESVTSSKGIGQNINDGESVTVTAQMTVHTADGVGSFGGNVQFNVEDICYDVASTLNCHGKGASLAGATSGNWLDSWATDIVYIPK